MINTKRILKELKKSKDKYGLSLTDLVNKTSLTRDNIRIAIANLLGAEKITETRIGMSKLYSVGGK